MVSRGFVPQTAAQSGNDSREAIEMAIGNAIERNSYVYIYDEKGRQVASIPCGTQEGNGLKGYTSTTVNVQRGRYIYTYNERGLRIASRPAY